MSPFAVAPPVASEQAARTDQIFHLLLWFSGAIVLLVVTLIAVFTIRYHRGSRAPRGNLPQLMTREFEIGWTSATIFLALFIFWWTASIGVAELVPPTKALEIHVVAKQWMWKTQHPEGAGEINALHVPIDTAVKLIMTSQDVIHSFFVPAFRMKKDVLPGRTTQTWFKATQLGHFPLLCAEYCGTQHSGMTGEIVVMTRSDYTSWVAAQPRGEDPAAIGAAVFQAQGCAACHGETPTAGGARRGPRLEGLYGTTVTLADGRQRVADEAYLRDSILHPRQDVVAGFDPIMPSYDGVLDETDLAGLLAYLRRLGAAGPDTTPKRTAP